MRKVSNLTSPAARRKSRVRGRITGTASKPRLSVYRTNKHIFVQAIDDTTGKTLVGLSDSKITKGTKTQRAEEVAAQVAAQLSKQNIKQVAFDRGSFRYHGRVKAVAESLRQNNINV